MSWSGLSETSRLLLATQAQSQNPKNRTELERLAIALAERARRGGWARSTSAAPSSASHQDLLTWSIVNRANLKPGLPFNLLEHPYLKGIYQETAKVVVLYKASQMGASEYAVSYALHAADARMATVLYIFPTDTHVSDFSSARIGPAIEASPYLNSIVVEGGGKDGKRGADRVTLKRVRDRFIYLRGGQVKTNGQAPQLKSIDADLIVLDEVDEMDPRAPSIAEKRLGHSTIAEQRWISTPTYPGVGIHAKWLESDQREWFVRCEACGERQPMTIHQVVDAWDELGRPTAWHDYVACQKCRRPLNRLAPGEWVAAFPDREIAGFHLTKLFGPTTSLKHLVQGLVTTDETKRREAFNQDLGETYTPRGGQITDGTLDDCRRDYGRGPVAGERTVMGVDVNKTLNVVIRGPRNAETGERPLRFAGELESFEAVGYLIKQYRVERCVIDALPETRKARELQADFAPSVRKNGMETLLFERGVVWLAYYVVQKTGSKNAEMAVWDKEKGVVNIDRTRALDNTFALFYDQQNTLPGDARDLPDYYAHLKAPVRTVEKDATGQPVARYVESNPDHYAHAENYCNIATMEMAVKRAGTWGRR
jgi:hypothetical protein